MDIVPGDHIGPYVILHPLGQGGMGQVFLADDSRLHRKVALKHLFDASISEATIRASLLREAQVVARITHPHVAMVHDIVEQGGEAFIVMEYVQGETLSVRLARERLPIPVVIEFGRQLASALAAAHAQGIIHRDLKPSNVQVTPKGTVKILDFGVAKVCELLSATAMTMAATVSATTHTTPIGTLGYMSPEQMLGRSVGPVSDLFSLGVVMFEMATGERLFPTADIGRILERMSTDLPRAYEVDPKIPSALSDAIARMLERDDSKRVQSAAAVEEKLGSLRERDTGSGEGNAASNDGALHGLRRRLILARGESEMMRLRYELEGYLAERPHDVDGRMLRDDLDRALSAQLHVGTIQSRPARTRSTARVSPVWSVAGITVMFALTSWWLISKGLSVAPQPIETAAVSPSTSSSTTTVPAGPTPEGVFQDHYGKAQTLIAEGNKTGARGENIAALAALPDDPRGVAQRTAIDALPDVAAAVPPTAAVGTPSVTGPAAAPPISETLRVTARAGESNAQRAARETAARAHLEDGKRALAEQKWVNAIDLLRAAITTSGRQDYGTVPNEAATLLTRGRREHDALVVADKRATAGRLVAEAKALGTSDIPQAIQKLRDARELVGDVEGAAELLNSLQEQARSQGEAALSSAKNFDNRNRTDQAIREYERAVQLLELVPGGHRDLNVAQQRLAELKR